MDDGGVKADHGGVKAGSTFSEVPGSAAVLTSATRARLVLAGEVDVSMNDELMEASSELEQTGLPIDVDVRHVTFMDSSVIAVLARLTHRVPSRLRIIEPPDVVRFLLDVTRIGELVEVVDADPGIADLEVTAGPDGAGAGSTPDGALSVDATAAPVLADGV
ncbi:STAS domain-containing protein [Georgenia yuyongxinii]|uniref:STAS domain-containing protein n=1 Tax=Georgenia yuyongxinii TaxID=2589797 RepID=A0A552WTH4_9MICO|nr:STAS domain-containing protein [Georgenia yuyongxinii]TRW46122.1 STAS domain-containing protein [Georgenia yuyongxinii]